MKTLIAFVAVLAVVCASPEVFRNPFAEAAEAVVGGAANLAKGAATLAGGAAGVVADTATRLVNGAAEVVGRTADVLLGFHQHGKAGYSSIFQYYSNIGVTFFPNYGCCSCPAPGVVQRGYPNYSSYSPFFINGVYQIDGSQYCTCPPELVASVVQAAYYNPKLLKVNIGRYVYPVSQLRAGRYAGELFNSRSVDYDY